MLRCLIVDDEPRSHVVLQQYISQILYLELSGQCYNAVQAYHFLKDHRVDIVFLDINMPEVDGFAFLEMLEHKPQVIFTTAYSEYALKGFEYNAIDYLHKPIRIERFIKAVEKALKWHCAMPIADLPVSIELKIDGRTERIPLDAIDYIQSMGNYVKIFCGARTIIAGITTKELEGILVPPSFIRVHKSYIVNTSKIKGVNGMQLSLNNVILPIGKTYKRYITQFVLR